MDTNGQKDQGSVSEVARLFLRLGITAFGGPAAHIAMFREEVVQRRGWLTDEEFLDLLGITNLIPGPNSTEMAIHIGYRRAGWRGLLAAGLCFILPAAVIVLLLAWVYVNYGTTPAGEAPLYGIKPVIIAIIVQALWGLAPKAAKTRLLTITGGTAMVLYLLGINELALLFGSGILIMVIKNFPRWQAQLPLIFGFSALATAHAADRTAAPFSITGLFFVFFKIGAVLYGSGYVLLAFMRGDLVDRLGWLSERQLLDAIAIGQFTPGPVFTTATFAGYLMGGLAGAVVATIGIFLPSFLFVALIRPLVPFLRSSVWFSALLDGVNVAALGLMAGVTLQIGAAAIVDEFTAVSLLIATVLLLRYKINSTWLILAGGASGIMYNLIIR